MTGARRRVLVVIAAVLLAAGALALAGRRAEPPRDRPTLLLLTSLPIVFSEDFSVDRGGSPALTALEARYDVRPISVTSARELGREQLLLLAHPPAQTAENLVALDRWVRAGGRVLLLADPLLEWPSARPLGDPLRPAPMFADTGLLRRWGLRLDAPDEAGPRMQRLGELEIMTASPGTLHGGCRVSPDRLTADCAIGKGRAMVVADADFIGVDNLDGPVSRNLDALVAALDDLSPADSVSGR